MNKEGLMVRSIQIFSERCSGSNYLESFLKVNFPDVDITWKYGWKHWMPQRSIESRDDELIIILVRSPFHWLRSIHRTPWHCEPKLKKKSFAEFIRAEWVCVYDSDARVAKSDSLWMTEMMHERNPIDGERFRNILEMRVSKHKVWLEEAKRSKRSLLLRYEDLLKCPDEVGGRIAQLLEVGSPRSFDLPKSYKGTFSWRRSLLKILTFGIYGGYRKRVARALNLSDIDYIRSELNDEFEQSIGYDMDVLTEEERARGINSDSSSL